MMESSNDESNKPPKEPSFQNGSEKRLPHVTTEFYDFEGCADGYGHLTFKESGNCISGHFQNSILNGKGKIRYSSNDEKDWAAGIFVNSKLNGSAVVVYKDKRQWYKGEVLDGKITGKGTFYHGNSVKTTGTFVDASVHGFASRTFADGSILSGDFKTNQFVGKGRFWRSDTDFYQGEFLEVGTTKPLLETKELVLNGYGHKVFKLNDQIVSCTGNFVLGKLEGEATVQFDPSGEIYVGQMRANLKHGLGKYKFSNGNVFIGTFVDDSMEGEGEIRFSNGNLYYGTIANNQTNGQGRFVWASKTLNCGQKRKRSAQKIKDYIEATSNCLMEYIGSFENGKLQPKGILKFTDGSTFEGPFIDGKPNGKGVFCYPEEQGGGSIEVEYVEGVIKPPKVGQLLRDLALYKKKISYLEKGNNNNSASTSHINGKRCEEPELESEKNGSSPESKKSWKKESDLSLKQSSTPKQKTYTIITNNTTEEEFIDLT